MILSFERRLQKLEQSGPDQEPWFFWAETEELAEQVRAEFRRDGRPLPDVQVTGDPEDNPPIGFPCGPGRHEEMVELMDAMEAEDLAAAEAEAMTRLANSLKSH